jgi:hypothetical protein
MTGLIESCWRMIEFLMLTDTEDILRAVAYRLVATAEEDCPSIRRNPHTSFAKGPVPPGGVPSGGSVGAAPKRCPGCGGRRRVRLAGLSVCLGRRSQFRHAGLQGPYSRMSALRSVALLGRD